MCATAPAIPFGSRSRRPRRPRPRPNRRPRIRRRLRHPMRTASCRSSPARTSSRRCRGPSRSRISSCRRTGLPRIRRQGRCRRPSRTTPGSTRRSLLRRAGRPRPSGRGPTGPRGPGRARRPTRRPGRGCPASRAGRRHDLVHRAGLGHRRLEGAPVGLELGVDHRPVLRPGGHCPGDRDRGHAGGGQADRDEGQARDRNGTADDEQRRCRTDLESPPRGIAAGGLGRRLHEPALGDGVILELRVERRGICAKLGHVGVLDPAGLSGHRPGASPVRTSRRRSAGGGRPGSGRASAAGSPAAGRSVTIASSDGLLGIGHVERDLAPVGQVEHRRGQCPPARPAVVDEGGRGRGQVRRRSRHVARKDRRCTRRPGRAATRRTRPSRSPAGTRSGRRPGPSRALVIRAWDRAAALAGVAASSTSWQPGREGAGQVAVLEVRRHVVVEDRVALVVREVGRPVARSRRRAGPGRGTCSDRGRTG